MPQRAHWLAVDHEHRAPATAYAHRLRARFAETDAMGVVHHASYPAWLEVARVELLRASGHPYTEVRAGGIDFAVVDLNLHYERPVHFDDEVIVTVWFAGASRASFELRYELRVGAERCVTASTRHAAVGLDGRPRRLPRWVTELAGDATPAIAPGATITPGATLHRGTAGSTC